MQFNLEGLALPITLRPAVALTDDELIRFSEQNKLYKIERNKEGELTVMTPVGGIGGNHEFFWQRSGAGFCLASCAPLDCDVAAISYL